MALTPERIKELSDRLLRVVGAGYVRPQDADGFARAIESEVRKQDTELIRQMLEALEQSQPYVESCANGKRVQWWGAQLDRAQDAINEARARLEDKP